MKSKNLIIIILFIHELIKINKKLVKNFNEKTKINKTTNEINQMNVLKNDILVNNYIQNNYEKLYGNFNNSNSLI